MIPGVYAAVFDRGDPDKPAKKTSRITKLLVISDLNSSYGSVTYSPEVSDVVSRIPAIDPDMILIPGDMVAGQKATLTESNIRNMWASFENTVLAPISATKKPLAITVGNHDASPGFKLDRRLAAEFWNTHKDKSNLQFVDDTHYPFYFSYKLNDIFFISWDAAASRIEPGVYEWMHEQLESKSAKSSQLQILMGHLPLYPIVESKNKPGEVNADPVYALDFFKKHGIDIYISGHQHAYYPARKQGISFLNSGCVGDGPRPLMGTNTPAQKTYTLIEIPARRPKRFTYKTYDAQSHQLVKPEQLPQSVAGFNGISYREIR